MSKYRPVRVSSMRGNITLPFNAFVRVSNKFVLYCREGEIFEEDRLRRLKEKKLSHMFVEEEQFEIYNKYTFENIDSAYDLSQGRTIEERAQIIQCTLQTCLEDLMSDPANESFYAVAIQGAKKFSNFFYTESALLKAMFELKNLDFSIAHHGIMTAAYSLAIIEELKMLPQLEKSIEHFTLGCFIHDIEHSFTNINMSVRPEKLTPPEAKFYSRHSITGADRIEKIKSYDPMVVKIIQQHEEQLNGAGPLKLKERDIDQYALVAAVGNSFDRILLYSNIAPKDALKQILIDKMGALSLPAMKALQDGIKKRGLI